MRFKEWLLTEADWRSLPKPIVINNHWVDGIDFRFEDWKKGANPEKSDVLYPAMYPTPFLMGASYSVPLRGRFMNINNSQFKKDWRISREEIDFTKQPRNTVLPPHWFNFAALYLGHQEVKEPEWPRERQVFRPTQQNTTMWAIPHGGRKVHSV